MTIHAFGNEWWKQAVVYQVYPRSFKDTDGNGLGDIRGITEKIEYLKELGTDAIWLSPFYPSELADGGYDVIDYRNVDPRLGTMEDFDEMTETAHEHGLKVIVDIVPNHTSNKHPWFQQALNSPKDSEARDRYIFLQGRGPKGEQPPNSWMSLFGGSAWEPVGDGQWYLHIFAKEQPDLNWKNPQVHEDFKKTFRFWSDHGTDGFRIDVAHGLAKDLESRPIEELGQWPVEQTLNHDGQHPLWDRPEVHDIYREWRKVFDEYTPPRFAIAEAWVVPEHQYLYASETELGQVFNFEFAKANWNSDEFYKAIVNGLNAASKSGSTTTWVMSNHDVPRQTTRYGLPQVTSIQRHQFVKDWILRDGESYMLDAERGTRRARAGFAMEAALPGSLYIYQGEELGLFEVPDIPWNRLEDPTPHRTSEKYTEKGRDGCRVPLPWEQEDKPQPAAWNPKFGTGASFGFSPKQKPDGKPAEDPHLPQPLWFNQFAVDREENDQNSMLSLYRKALHLRKTLLSMNVDDDLLSLEDNNGILQYARPLQDEGQHTMMTVITNFSQKTIALPEGDIALSSNQLQGTLLPPDTTAWVLH